jgi:nicotinamide-nucleotide amidase
MADAGIESLAFEIVTVCARDGLTVGTVESCTGGLIAGALTAVPGSSAVVMAGLVTYSNAAKTRLAGVPAALIAADGAVSESVARAMAEGGMAALEVDLACAVTGIAGPGGATPGKPVGLVHVAVARTGHSTLHRAFRFGDVGRAEVRQRSVASALDMLLTMIRGDG